MKVTKQLKHTIRMGDYESLTVTAEVTVDTLEDQIAGTRKFDDADIAEYLDELLATIVAHEMGEARALAPDSSYIHNYIT